MDLRPAEIRVLGCLMEKQRTTPDAYPLTLNALRLACNQATNREPVVDYDEDTIREAIHRLERHGLARLASGAGSRAPKFRHLLADRMTLDDGQQALLCALMLRGPQTAGELKQRTDRLHTFSGPQDVQRALQDLMERQLVAAVARRPGQKEQRYLHRLGGETNGEPMTQHVESTPVDGERPGRGETLAELGQRVDRLEAEVSALREALGG